MGVLAPHMPTFDGFTRPPIDKTTRTTFENPPLTRKKNIVCGKGGWIGAHAKFHNPRTTPSLRKVSGLEKKRKRDRRKQAQICAEGCEGEHFLRVTYSISKSLDQMGIFLLEKFVDPMTGKWRNNSISCSGNSTSFSWKPFWKRWTKWGYFC